MYTSLYLELELYIKLLMNHFIDSLGSESAIYFECIGLITLLFLIVLTKFNV